jgi:hypothetical protein
MTSPTSEQGHDQEHVNLNHFSPERSLSILREDHEVVDRRISNVYCF